MEVEFNKWPLGHHTAIIRYATGFSSCLYFLSQTPVIAGGVSRYSWYPMWTADVRVAKEVEIIEEAWSRRIAAMIVT